MTPTLDIVARAIAICRPFVDAVVVGGPHTAVKEQVDDIPHMSMQQWWEKEKRSLSVGLHTVMEMRHFLLVCWKGEKSSLPGISSRYSCIAHASKTICSPIISIGICFPRMQESVR